MERSRDHLKVHFFAQYLGSTWTHPQWKTCFCTGKCNPVAAIELEHVLLEDGTKPDDALIHDGEHPDVIGVPQMCNPKGLSPATDRAGLWSRPPSTVAAERRHMRGSVNAVHAPLRGRQHPGQALRSQPGADAGTNARGETGSSARGASGIFLPSCSTQKRRALCWVMCDHSSLRPSKSSPWPPFSHPLVLRVLLPATVSACSQELASLQSRERVRRSGGKLLREISARSDILDLHGRRNGNVERSQPSHELDPPRPHSIRAAAWRPDEVRRSEAVTTCWTCHWAAAMGPATILNPVAQTSAVQNALASRTEALWGTHKHTHAHPHAVLVLLTL